MTEPSAADVLKMLAVLERKLNDEGLYVRANTAALAIELIQSLMAKASPPSS